MTFRREPCSAEEMLSLLDYFTWDAARAKRLLLHCLAAR